MLAVTTRTIVFASLIIAILASGPPARAERAYSVGRQLGVLWGDGYHARTACPPRLSGCRMAPAAPKPLPWWATPAPPAEQLPHPAEAAPGVENSPPPAGSSLLRQPGEGTSLSIAPGR